MTTPEFQQFAQQLQNQVLILTEQINKMKQEQEIKYNNNENNKNTKTKLKPTTPETFNGDRRNNAEIWLAELENYFNILNENNDEERIKFAVGQLRGLAVTWWKHVVNSNTVTEVQSDWNVFKQTLLNNYKPVEAKETARVAIYRLKQMGPVAQYCDIFLRHLNNIEDMGLADQLFLFKQGLQPQIQREVNIQQPKSLAEAMSYAQRAEITLRIYNGPRNNNTMNFRNSVPRYINSSNNTNSHSISVPMELSNINSAYDNYTPNYITVEHDSNHYNEYINEDYSNNTNEIQNEQLSNDQQNLNAINYNNNRNNYPNKYSNSNAGSNVRISGLTREQIENYKRTGSCFYCGQRGHMKSQCPKLSNKLNSINTTQQYNNGSSNSKK